MPKTAQGILVVEPGAKYLAYCNRCSWKASTNKTTIPDAQEVARAHAAKDCKP